MIEVQRDATGPYIITICGSLRYTRQMLIAHHEFSNRGFMCFLPNINLEEEIPTGSSPSNEDAGILHDAKISFGDAIYIVNVDGYIGESTYHEYKLAQKLGKRIFWWGQENEKVMDKTREYMRKLDKKLSRKKK